MQRDVNWDAVTESCYNYALDASFLICFTLHHASQFIKGGSCPNCLWFIDRSGCCGWFVPTKLSFVLLFVPAKLNKFVTRPSSESSRASDRSSDRDGNEWRTLPDRKNQHNQHKCILVFEHLVLQDAAVWQCCRHKSYAPLAAFTIRFLCWL